MIEFDFFCFSFGFYFILYYMIIVAKMRYCDASEYSIRMSYINAVIALYLTIHCCVYIIFTAAYIFTAFIYLLLGCCGLIGANWVMMISFSSFFFFFLRRSLSGRFYIDAPFAIRSSSDNNNLPTILQCVSCFSLCPCPFFPFFLILPPSLVLLIKIPSPLVRNIYFLLMFYDIEAFRENMIR